MWLLHKLRDALLRKKGKGSALVSPQAGSKAEKDKPGAALGHISKQADAHGPSPGCKNCSAPARVGGSISLATGNESFTHTDFVLAAPLPIEWARTYSSDLDAFDRGSLGARWITPYSMRVDITTPTRGARKGRASMVYHAADGRSHSYPVLAVGQAYRDAIEEITVSRLSETLLALDFGKPLPAGAQPEWRELYELVDSKQPHFRLVTQQAKDGQSIGLRYDHVIASTGEQVLSDIISKQGDVVMAHVGTQPDAKTGLIRSLWELKDGQVVRQLAAYTHDAEHDLIAAQDENGASWSYTYSHHLVTRYTDRTGRGMNLEYDGTGADAKAVREWSDDGSFALQLEWDANIRLTYVTDALGARPGTTTTSRATPTASSTPTSWRNGSFEMTRRTSRAMCIPTAPPTTTPTTKTATCRRTPGPTAAGCTSSTTASTASPAFATPRAACGSATTTPRAT
nr:DUF6531 domain-containing protein [Variovorax sp. S12S4]